jgi:transglycosylase-like protein with SLT domain
MSRNESAVRSSDLADLPLRHAAVHARESEPRTIVIRHGSVWQSLAFLCLCLLLLAAILLGHRVLGSLDRQNQENAVAMARFERKVQEVESGMEFQSERRRLLLGMRDHIMRVNARVSLGDAYRYAELAVRAGEKYPAVDPLLLLAIGTVESRFDPQAISRANARGLYQIWPATGRLLLRALGWEYDEVALYDPEKNTEAAALYLDILFSTYGDPQMVLAEYNGGPLNAGYFRAGAGALAAETRSYVPQVLALYDRLKEAFSQGPDLQADLMHRDGGREGKTLAGAAAAGSATAARRRSEAPRTN